ncbi:MAG: hypothetical protein A2Y75_11605 [Candidatus Solincola sediminis]|uniref:Transglutaminase-like domain-containing protein n=1 Tax=Candidatus Solincola sediminis TaxID=1797199 RepID=A0A1F2WRL4_9ACTN|nr:MAG: hypothetical protein A2Y75_11605 [Candidatus Solincola sediminis]
MKKLSPLLISVLIALILFLPGCTTKASNTGEGLFKQAQVEQEQGNFVTAKDLYNQAQEKLTAEGNSELAAECGRNRQNMDIIAMTYPIKEDDMRQMLEREFPQVAEDIRESWIEDGKLERTRIDGEMYYFGQVIANIKFRNTDLFQQDATMMSHYEQGYLKLKAIMDEGNGDPWQPFIRPVTIKGNAKFAIPRDKLPQAGLFKVWLPIPIITGPQPNVEVTSITPGVYVKNPPSIDQDIGLIYMEVPLDELGTDLNIDIQFTFDHYEQRFQIDPTRIGDYDQESELYKQYTKSSENTTITTDIRDTAVRVVGDESNPYLAAKIIYDYVIKNITYSFMPHPALWPRGETESEYVHNNRYGDCGAQSMYFSALCRAIGIPARTTGGWQLFSGNFAGHFWAEFFIPEYGWIPADPTAATLVDYLSGVSDADKQSFHDFYFANQDHLRCNVQKDVDVALIPPAEQSVFLPMAIQEPAMLCDGMDQAALAELLEYWSMTAQGAK